MFVSWRRNKKKENKCAFDHLSTGVAEVSRRGQAIVAPPVFPTGFLLPFSVKS